MKHFTMNQAFIPDMGSISAMSITGSYGETKEEQALWQINSMRRHDGLPELNKLPDDIQFTPVKGTRHD